MIGSLDQTITLYSAVKSISSSGEAVTSYTLFGKAFARIELTGVESMEQGQYNAYMPSIKLTMHNQSGINTGMRIVYEGINYDIQSVAVVEQRKYLQIIAKIEQV
jgi:head-tail adaptor